MEEGRSYLKRCYFQKRYCSIVVCHSKRKVMPCLECTFIQPVRQIDTFLKKKCEVLSVKALSHLTYNVKPFHLLINNSHLALNRNMLLNCTQTKFTFTKFNVYDSQSIMTPTKLIYLLAMKLSVTIHYRNYFLQVAIDMQDVSLSWNHFDWF